ncbi:unnamed protein product [Brassica rapa subsp. trilocularis]
MDQRVVTADNQAVIHQVALLGMSCTRMCGVERPDMRRVAEDLRGLQASGQVVQDEADISLCYRHIELCKMLFEFDDYFRLFHG